jgi:hypothetical protein
MRVLNNTKDEALVSGSLEWQTPPPTQGFLFSQGWIWSVQYTKK